MKEDVAVLGDLDVTAARHQHLHSAFGTQVGLQHLLQSLGRIDVEGQGLGRAVDLKYEMQTIFQWKFFCHFIDIWRKIQTSNIAHLGLGVEKADGGHLDGLSGAVSQTKIRTDARSSCLSFTDFAGNFQKVPGWCLLRDMNKSE